jgi:hypothetical protein
LSLRCAPPSLRIQRALASAAFLLLLAGSASPAAAVSVGRFFAHQLVFEGTGFGVAENLTQAEDFGVPIFFEAGSDPAVTSGSSPPVDGTARIFELNPFSSNVELSEVAASAGTATASYSITLSDSFLNLRRSDDELVYLLFATSRPSEVGGVTYASRDVGILIDDLDPAFAILSRHNDDENVALFYPALLLPNGGVGDSFSIDISVEGGFDVVNGTSAVPNFLVGAAYVSVIPEPATAGLIALGLLGLAVSGGRRRQA